MCGSQMCSGGFSHVTGVEDRRAMTVKAIVVQTPVLR